MKSSILVILAATAVANGQAYTPPNLKTELFGGFSNVGLKPGPDLKRASWNGWTASATSYQVFRRWGLAAEFGSNFGKNDARQDSYLFGGTYRGFERRKLAVTGRILAGVTRLEQKAGSPGLWGSQNGFTFGFGQSVDVKLSEHFALRAQPDLRFVRFKDRAGSAKTSLALPVSFGIVFKFGSR
jgi:hypothetical protein